MKFHIATDHAGIELKDYTVELLKDKGHEVIDLGPFCKTRVDYPDYAHKVATSVLNDSSSHGNPGLSRGRLFFRILLPSS